MSGEKIINGLREAVAHAKAGHAQPSRTITASDASIVRALLPHMHQHEIAALLGCNQGRIAEIAAGDRAPSAAPADLGSPTVRDRILRYLFDHQDRMAASLRRALWGG